MTFLRNLVSFTDTHCMAQPRFVPGLGILGMVKEGGGGGGGSIHPLV